MKAVLLLHCACASRGRRFFDPSPLLREIRSRALLSASHCLPVETRRKRKRTTDESYCAAEMPPYPGPCVSAPFSRQMHWLATTDPSCRPPCLPGSKAKRWNLAHPVAWRELKSLLSKQNARSTKRLVDLYLAKAERRLPPKSSLLQWKPLNPSHQDRDDISKRAESFAGRSGHSDFRPQNRDLREELNCYYQTTAST